MWLLVFLCFLLGLCRGIKFDGVYSSPPFYLILHCMPDDPLPFLRGHLVQVDQKIAERIPLYGMAIEQCESLSPLKGFLVLENATFLNVSRRLEESWKLYLDDSALLITPVKSLNSKTIQLRERRTFSPLNKEEYETFLMNIWLNFLEGPFTKLFVGKENFEKNHEDKEEEGFEEIDFHRYTVDETIFDE